MKWFRKHRPRVHYWFWTVLMVLNLLIAILCAWASSKFEVAMNFQMIAASGLAIVSYLFTRIWQHWIDNPDEYEKLHKVRLRRLRRRMGGTGRRGESTKEKEESKK